MPLGKVPDHIYEVIKKTIEEHEGGYVNDPADPGGETQFGISKRTYPDVDIADLTMDQAIDIYWRDWWNRKMRWLLKIDDSDLAAKLFDIGINVGASRAAKFLQLSCRHLGARLVIDGVVGPRTLAAVNAYDPEELEKEFSVQAALYYSRLAMYRRSMAKFLKGWLRRAFA